MAKKNNIYLIDGKKVPSVTTILNVINKPGLLKWYGKLGTVEAERQRDSAASFGSAVHAAIESVCMGQTPVYSDHRLQTTTNNFKVWADNHIEEWVYFEKAIFHDELKYAGTVDAYARLKGSGKLVLVDFKSSRSVHDEYYLQVAAYMNATRVEDNLINPKDVEGAIIVHLEHDTLMWESVNVHVTDELFEVFKSCLTIYKWQNT